MSEEKQESNPRTARRRWPEMVKIIKTRDRVNGDSRNYGVVEYVKRAPFGYIGRTASGYPIFIYVGHVQAIEEVA